MVKLECGVITAIFPALSSDAIAITSTIDQLPKTVRPVDLQSVFAGSPRSMGSLPQSRKFMAVLITVCSEALKQLPISADCRGKVSETKEHETYKESGHCEYSVSRITARPPFRDRIETEMALHQPIPALL